MITKVVGVTFENEEYGVNRQQIIKHLNGKERIILKREPKNRFDPNAVAVYILDDKKEIKKIGFLKAELAGMVSEMWNTFLFIARIHEIRDGDDGKGISWGISLRITKRKKTKKIKKNKRKRYANI